MRAFVKNCTVLCLGSILLSSCGNNSGDEKRDFVPMVKVERATDARPEWTREYPGQVIANQRVDLAFQVNGRIEVWNAKDGKAVEVGEVLAKLDDTTYRQRVNETEARFQRAKNDLIRSAQLLKSGTISASMYDEKREANDVAQANLKTAQKDLDDTVLRSPFSGVIANTFVENFQDVQAKERVLSLQNIGNVDILIDVPERDFALNKKRDLKHGAHIKHQIRFENHPQYRYSVAIKEFATEADPVTQTFKITLTMPSPEEIVVLPGMNATLLVDASQYQETYVTLPVQAVAIDEQGKHFIWVVDMDSLTISKRIVDVGEVIGNEILIKDGVQADEHVVVAGVSYLEDGMTIRLFADYFRQDQQ